MMKTSLVTAIFGVVIGAAVGAKIGAPCANATECAAQNSFCFAMSPSCPSGVCACLPGFTLQPDGNCNTPTPLSSKCTQSSECSTYGGACIRGTCRCNDRNYKMSPYGDQCIPRVQTKKFKENCTNDEQCFGNLVCNNKKCDCDISYKPKDDYNCQPRGFGDKCRDLSDCETAPNAICSTSKKCECDEGYRSVSYRRNLDEIAQVCIPTDDEQLGEGETCKPTIDNTLTAVCSEDFFCASCFNDEPPTCLSNVVKLESSSNYISASLAVTLTTNVLAAIIFLAAF